MLLKNLINPIYSASSTLKSLFDKAWEMLTSKQAILIYAVILLVLIIVIILVIMSNEQKQCNKTNNALYFINTCCARNIFSYI